MADIPSIEERIHSILRDECRDPSRAIHRDDVLYDLYDSLGVVEVVMALEDEFELQVPEADAARLKTVGELIDYILEHVRDRPDRAREDGGAAAA